MSDDLAEKEKKTFPEGTLGSFIQDKPNKEVVERFINERGQLETERIKGLDSHTLGTLMTSMTDYMKSLSSQSKNTNEGAPSSEIQPTEAE